jgi:predicted nuclease of predicted toxin-antitoxin system
MRLLLDESVNFRLNRRLPGHDVWTTKQMGWDGYRNGELLTLARGRFDVLITRDQSIPFQQSMTEEDMAVVVLFSGSNSIADLEPLAPKVLEVLATIECGQVARIYAEP